MHDRFRLLALKFPLQKRPEAKEILLVPTDAAQNPIIGLDLSEPSANLPLCRVAGKLTEGWTDFALKDGILI
jgi:hypothetical protein